MKWLGIALALIACLVLVVYLWPVPRKDFAQLATKVDPATRQSLLAFRAAHPPQTLTAAGQTWEYIAFGDGPEAVLFLHGMTGAYDIWWQQMEVLADHYRVVSLSYPPVDTLEGLSEGVLAVLDASGVQRATVVGSSLGGYLTQYMMTIHPQRIQRAVLGNTFPPNEILAAKNASLINLLPFLPNWLVMKVFRGSFVNNIYPAANHSELVLAYMLEQVAGRMSKAQVTARAKAVIEPFTPPDPQALGIPVMIIEADNDPLVEPELRQLLRDTYPSATVHTLHHAGHFPYLNEAETYTGLLETFLRGSP